MCFQSQSMWKYKKWFINKLVISCSKSFKHLFSLNINVYVPWYLFYQIIFLFCFNVFGCLDSMLFTYEIYSWFDMSRVVWKCMCSLHTIHLSDGDFLWTQRGLRKIRTKRAWMLQCCHYVMQRTKYNQCLAMVSVLQEATLIGSLTPWSRTALPQRVVPFSLSPPLPCINPLCPYILSFLFICSLVPLYFHPTLPSLLFRLSIRLSLARSIQM